MHVANFDDAMLASIRQDSNHFHFADDIPSHVIVSGTLPFVRLPNFKAKKERRKPPHQRAIGTSGKGDDRTSRF